MTEKTIQLIDLGTPGDESLGDTLFDGGEKINANFEHVWQTFASDDGELVGTLPYNRNFNPSLPLRPNRKYDVDTFTGPLVLRLAATTSELYQTGDVIVLRDFRGNWFNANVALIFENGDGSINGQNQTAFRNSFIEVRLTCVDATENKWISSVQSLKDNSYKEVDMTRVVTLTNGLNEVLYRTDIFHAMKFLVVASANTNPNQKTVSEILVTDDGSDAVFTEYAILNTTTTGDPLVNVSFNKINNEIWIDATTNPGFPSNTVQILEIEKIAKVN